MFFILYLHHYSKATTTRRQKTEHYKYLVKVKFKLQLALPELYYMYHLCRSNLGASAFIECYSNSLEGLSH
jgi:hypothetical protein